MNLKKFVENYKSRPVRGSKEDLRVIYNAFTREIPPKDLTEKNSESII
ncbi:hypothetical protein HOE04_02320 [archaeon]|nr:hypothetical protein [archaeon]